MEMLRTGRIILPVFDCAIKGILVYSVHSGVYNLKCKFLFCKIFKALLRPIFIYELEKELNNNDKKFRYLDK